MITITAQLLQAATDIRPSTARAVAQPLQAATTRYRINASANRLGDFLAQVGHESAGFTAMTEGLSYSDPARLVRLFRKFDLDGDRAVDANELELARTLLHKPVELANFVYGGKLGNSEPGDGYKFRGRTWLQITGRANYVGIRDKLRADGAECPDFEREPDAINEPRWCALAACAWWDSRNLNELADAGDFLRETLRINQAKAGLSDRQARRARAIAALKGTA